MVNEPKKRSITGKLVANVLTEREDDFTYNVTYVANRSIKDLCRIRAAKGSKYTAAEYESMCNDLEETAKEEMYSGSTVESTGRLSGREPLLILQRRKIYPQSLPLQMS